MNDESIIDAEIVTIDDAAGHHGIDPRVMREFVMTGDLSAIAKQDRPGLVMALCRYIGVDPIERPFSVFKDGKREVLYANRACTSALCRVRRISREVIAVEEKTIAGQLVIFAKARATMLSTGRYDESTGVVPVMVDDKVWDEQARRKVSKGWRMPDPNEAANLPMKAETKAKRRAVLDLVGLGLTDESEIDTIKGARIAQINMETGETFGAEPRAIAAAPDPVDPLGPRCAGKAAGIARAIADRVQELAVIMGIDEARVYHVALRKLKIDLDKYPTPPRPVDLTTSDGQALSGFLKQSLDRHAADHEAGREREPGDDDDHDPTAAGAL